MSHFDLKQNPFFILEVSLRDGRESILERTESLLADGKLTEDIVSKAQRELFASKSRLAAELGWLLEVNPKRAFEVRSKFLCSTDASMSDIEPTIRELEGLSCANLSAHFCSLQRATVQVFGELIAAWHEILPSKIKTLVNENRAISGFPEVSEELITEALLSLKESHAKSGFEWLRSASHPGQTLTEILVTLTKKSKQLNDFVELIVEKYETWAISKLKSFEEKIAENFRLMKEAGDTKKNKEYIDTIISLLRDWDEYSQPSQLLHQSKGLDEPRARRVFDEVRQITLWLANEKNEHALSLEFSKSLLDIFPELPASIARLEEDIKTLSDLVAESKAKEDFAPLLTILETILTDEKPFNRSVLRGEFAKDKRGIGGSLYKAIVSVRGMVKGKPHEADMWALVRKIAIYLYNEKNCIQSALTILRTLNDFGPSDVIVRQINDDVRTLERNALHDQFKSALESKAIRRARDLSKQLVDTATDDDDRRGWSEVHTTLVKKRSEQVVKNSLGVAIFGIIAICGALSDNKKSTSASSRPHSSAYQTQQNKNIPAVEIKPAPGTSILNINGLRWCTFEKERLDYITNQFSQDPYEKDPVKRWNRSLLSQAIIDSYVSAA